MKLQIKKSEPKMRIMIAMALLLLTPFALSYTVDDNFAQIVGGGQAASANYGLTAAIQQVVVGEAASANYNTWMGWAYTIDSNNPIVYGFNPPNGAGGITSQSISFSIFDNWIGADQNNTIAYLNGTQSGAFNPRTDCSTTGTTTTCSYTETGLGTAGDYNITIRAIDYAGNQATGTTLFHYMGGQPTQPSTGGGGVPTPSPEFDLNYSFKAKDPDNTTLTVTTFLDGNATDPSDIEVLLLFPETGTMAQDTNQLVPATKTRLFTKQKARMESIGENAFDMENDELLQVEKMVITATIQTHKVEKTVEQPEITQLVEAALAEYQAPPQPDWFQLPDVRWEEFTTWINEALYIRAIAIAIIVAMFAGLVAKNRLI